MIKRFLVMSALFLSVGLSQSAFAAEGPVGDVFPALAQGPVGDVFPGLAAGEGPVGDVFPGVATGRPGKIFVS